MICLIRPILAIERNDVWFPAPFYHSWQNIAAVTGAISLKSRAKVAKFPVKQPMGLTFSLSK
jgi:hypothetical protein